MDTLESPLLTNPSHNAWSFMSVAEERHGRYEVVNHGSNKESIANKDVSLIKVAAVVAIAICLRFAIELRSSTAVPTGHNLQLPILASSPANQTENNGSALGGYSEEQWSSFAMANLHRDLRRLNIGPLAPSQRCRLVVLRDPLDESDVLSIDNLGNGLVISVRRAAIHKQIPIPDANNAEWGSIIARTSKPPRFAGEPCLDGEGWILEVRSSDGGYATGFGTTPWFPRAPIEDEDPALLEAWARLALLKATVPMRKRLP